MFVPECQDALSYIFSSASFDYSFNTMVYTGKPSRGCGMCKSRRIKVCIGASRLLLLSLTWWYRSRYLDTSSCEPNLGSPANHAQCDEKRPTCGNCKKSTRVCPGYPDDFDLVFRDENKAMAKKARKSSGTTPSNSSTGGSSSQTSPHLYVYTEPHMPPRFKPSARQLVLWLAVAPLCLDRGGDRIG